VTQFELAFDESVRALLSKLANEGMLNAARGFSGMVGEPISVSGSAAQLVPLAALPEMLGGPENEAVGIYLRATGDLPGQIMLVVPFEKALELCDMLLGVSEGTTQSFGTLERSALQELGNVAASFFLNSMANALSRDTRPSPPAVMVDMIGAILDIVVATAGGQSEHVLMLQAVFMRAGRGVDCSFWMLPDPAALQELAQYQALGHAH
jgi:chemotaxis protein CheC